MQHLQGGLRLQPRPPDVGKVLMRGWIGASMFGPEAPERFSPFLARSTAHTFSFYGTDVDHCACLEIHSNGESGYVDRGNILWRRSRPPSTRCLTVRYHP